MSSKRQTSADIIRESKMLLNYKSLRPIDAKRPETPMEEHMKFLNRGSPAFISKFQLDSRPSSAVIKLAPLDLDKTRSSSATHKPLKPMKPLVASHSTSNSFIQKNEELNIGDFSDLQVQGKKIKKHEQKPQSTLSLVSKATKDKRKKGEDGETETPSLPPKKVIDIKLPGQEEALSLKLNKGKKIDETSDKRSFSKVSRDPLPSPHPSSSSPTSSIRHAEERIEKLLFKLEESLKNPSSNYEETEKILLKLKEEVEGRGLRGRRSEKRNQMLKSICPVVDLDLPALNQVVCSIMIMLDVRGQNFLNVTKLLLNLMKSNQLKPQIFIDELTIKLEKMSESLASSQLILCPETIETLSNMFLIFSHPSVLPLISSSGFIPTLIRFYRLFIEKEASASFPSESSHKLIMNLTGLTRNILEGDDWLMSDFRKEGGLEHVIRCMENAPYQIVFNVARILSKITTKSESCDWLSQNLSHTPIIQEAFSLYYQYPEVCLRLSFVLGNVAIKGEEWRNFYYSLPHVFSFLISTFQFYIKKFMQRNQDLKKKEENKEVLLKIMRFLANLSLSEKVGKGMSHHPGVFEVLIQVLDLTSNDELTSTAVLLLGNISYYCLPEEDRNEEEDGVKGEEKRKEVESKSQEKREETKENEHLEKKNKEKKEENKVGCGSDTILLKQLPLFIQKLSVLFSIGKNGSDIIRIYGNLARVHKARQQMRELHIEKILFNGLRDEDCEVVYSVLGSLINFLLDDQTKYAFKKFVGVQELLEVMRRFEGLDWQLVGMACQALYNLSFQKSLHSSFTIDEQNKIKSFIRENLKNKENASEDEEMKKYKNQIKIREFDPVAKTLLEKLEKSQN